MCQERYRFENWATLVGMDVEIRHTGTNVRSGWVDAAMEDGTALWLAQDGALERKIIEKAEGFSAWGTTCLCGAASGGRRVK